MIAYIDEHKDRFGVEPICRHLPIAPSTYYEVKSRRPSARKLRDEELKVEIERTKVATLGWADFGTWVCDFPVPGGPNHTSN